jgi:hypothetical protein
VSKQATQAWNSLGSYFDQALSTPTGQKLRNFYEQGNKQVIDVHNEARHLANLKSGKASSGGASGSTDAAPGSTVPPVDAGFVEKPAEGDKKI